ncbi:unnamed protein product [Soboliphyme baturini]|uniref:Ig-like domain-containing protein n=1 Tax=Soboliphyme baturini TaxID=241478 RepID=A0A183J0P2_9BILA|nr:unnamed protein product [Soboliphyme baturini]
MGGGMRKKCTHRRAGALVVLSFCYGRLQENVNACTKRFDGPAVPANWLAESLAVWHELQKDGNKFRLVMSNVQLADAGRFECQALNAAGSKSSSCTLIVAPSPSPVPNGRTVPLMYKIENDVESGICLLTISTMFAEDVGEYSCVAENQHGVAKTVAEVLHKDQYERWIKDEQTKITSEKKRSMMQELDSAVLQPRKQKGTFYTPQTQRFLEQRFSATDQGTTTDGQREQVSGFRPFGPIVTLLNEFQQWLSETQVGEARQGVADGTQAVPVFLRPLGFVQVHEGQDAVFHCQLGGNPKPKICWMKDGEPVAPSQRILMTYRGTMAELIIKMAFPEDSGSYTLMAQNQFGTCEDTGKLLVTPFGEKVQRFSGQKYLALA